MEADLMTLLVDSESWSAALYSGSIVDCQIDSHVAKAEPVSLTLNNHDEGDQHA